MANSAEMDHFHDFLPLMAQKLGEDGLMQELAKGFKLLADPSTQTITLHSLRENGSKLGLPPMSDDELKEMIGLGGGNFRNSGGQFELDFGQFCVAMVRTSPGLIDQTLADLVIRSDPSLN